MKTVNIAELKNSLSAYVRLVRKGEEVVIRDRKLPVAKLVPFPAGDASEETLRLVAEGKMRLPEKPLDVEAFLKLPIPKTRSGSVIEVLLKEREEGW